MPIMTHAMTSTSPTGVTRPNTGMINNHAIGQQTAHAGQRSRGVSVATPTATAAQSRQFRIVSLPPRVIGSSWVADVSRP